jgi:hypothetical protein
VEDSDAVGDVADLLAGLANSGLFGRLFAFLAAAWKIPARGAINGCRRPPQEESVAR